MTQITEGKAIGFLVGLTLGLATYSAICERPPSDSVQQTTRPKYFSIPGQFNGRELEPTEHWYVFDNNGDGKVDELIVWKNMDRGELTALDIVCNAMRTPEGRSIDHYLAKDAQKYNFKTVKTKELPADFAATLEKIMQYKH